MNKICTLVLCGVFSLVVLYYFVMLFHDLKEKHTLQNDAVVWDYRGSNFGTNTAMKCVYLPKVICIGTNQFMSKEQNEIYHSQISRN
jgi:hypothetical protein